MKIPQKNISSTNAEDTTYTRLRKQIENMNISEKNLSSTKADDITYIRLRKQLRNKKT